MGWFGQAGETVVHKKRKFFLMFSFVVFAYTAATSAQTMSGEAKVCEALLTSKQYDKAFSRCLKAANEGDVTGQLLLASLYENGRGVAESKQLAHVWYLRAAKLGNVAGQIRVAQMYRDGIGTNVDKMRARLWFEQAHKSLPRK